MAKHTNMNNSTLFLLRYLAENTDIDHPVTSVQLQKVLADRGMSANPRTIRREAAKLKENGFEINVEARNSVPTEYYYDGTDWEKPEARILIDAVASAPFLTVKKTDQLIRKLSLLAGRRNAEELKPQVCVSEHFKAKNENILIILDRISEAIRTHKKISFRMLNYNTSKENILRHNGEVYVLSPYDTVWKDDRYYAVGWSDKRNCVVQHRLDRLEIPKILDEALSPPPKPTTSSIIPITSQRCTAARLWRSPSAATSASWITSSTSSANRCRSQTSPRTAFDATASASVSGTFLSWVFQYAGQMHILSPEPARRLYEEMLTAALEGARPGAEAKVKERRWKL